MATIPPSDGAALRERQQAVWDRSAPGWLRRAGQDTGEDAITARLLALAGVRPGQRVLDLACGVGDPAFALAARVGSAGSVLGLDLSQAMVDGAWALARERGIGNAVFRRIDSELELGVPDGGFDAATCRFGLMFVPDPAGAMAAVRRALRPGGRVAVSTWGSPERTPYFALPEQIVRRHVDLPPPDQGTPAPGRLPTPEVLERILRDAGFVGVETVAVEASLQTAAAPAAFWDARIERAGTLGVMFAELPEATRRAIREDAIRTLGELFPDGPVRLGAEALVAAGMNPG